MLCIMFCRWSTAQSVEGVGGVWMQHATTYWFTSMFRLRQAVTFLPFYHGMFCVDDEGTHNNKLLGMIQRRLSIFSWWSFGWTKRNEVRATHREEKKKVQCDTRKKKKGPWSFFILTLFFSLSSSLFSFFTHLHFIIYTMREIISVHVGKWSTGEQWWDSFDLYTTVITLL
jgi:hypothetical protein